MNIASLRKTAAQAKEWAEQHYPDASSFHKEAFANAVIYLTAGISCGDTGPSMREHLVVRSLLDNPETEPGEWKFEDACLYAARYCFSPAHEYMLELRSICMQEFCLDDDPEDIEVLKDLELL